MCVLSDWLDDGGGFGCDVDCLCVDCFDVEDL